MMNLFFFFSRNGRNVIRACNYKNQCFFAWPGHILFPCSVLGIAIFYVLVHRHIQQYRHWQYTSVFSLHNRSHTSVYFWFSLRYQSIKFPALWSSIKVCFTSFHVTSMTPVPLVCGRKEAALHQRHMDSFHKVTQQSLAAKCLCFYRCVAILPCQKLQQPFVAWPTVAIRVKFFISPASYLHIITVQVQGLDCH